MSRSSEAAANADSSSAANKEIQMSEEQKKELESTVKSELSKAGMDTEGRDYCYTSLYLNAHTLLPG